MKRSNIILTAIGLISLLVGTLAFKAQHRFSGALFCYTTVGIPSPGGITYAPILVERYSAMSSGNTLICTIPGVNVTYHEIKVIQSL
ncbi:hypothetical protein [Chitinophaga sancti]|uniref:Uncharacterized protein n=1 Tax=Chitinophaga sancti TaxID=1004 RepID=A0A1K1T2T9_9BACT|nr:hypothetical protein [Chitinophaga sancti]WQD59553.1 hypothetical protein U0033_16795 [Chitinophaga sancti]WQG88313.1 hypothetical protein SR876_25670 [Chitinophaga sancti]SFW90647.1 hypothetical protein SAMN05661012_06651 [Chitinophaga sancti]